MTDSLYEHPVGAFPERGCTSLGKRDVGWFLIFVVDGATSHPSANVAMRGKERGRKILFLILFVGHTLIQV
jgi:hypothetical protein